MKAIYRLIGLCLMLSVAAFSQIAAEVSTPPDGNNQRAEVSQWIGLVKVTIAYHSPRVHFPPDKDRTGHIWGEVLQYGLFDDGYGPSGHMPWRAGANESTTISFSHDVKIDGKDVKAGTYALFLELGKDAPDTWILSSNVGWGSYQYDPKNDVLRVSATRQDAPFTEFLTYSFDERLPESAVANLTWEKKRMGFKIEVPNVNELYVAQLRKDLQAWPGFYYRNWQLAAQFCANNNINLDEALVWADRAIKEPFRGIGGGREDFSTLRTKASVLEAMHRDTDAATVMDKAIHLPTTNARVIYNYGMQTLRSGKKDRAMDIFKTNKQLHADDKFWTSLGLARGYAATGDKKTALENMNTALQNVPDDQSANKAALEKELNTLKSGQ
jgi:tetratricopeptide (TPR) repeat protein